ncbi:MAG: signal transduction histidine kinase [Candidatus Paceibacteria bacterium]|jgi:signal transduction histidine kinase
MNPIDYVLQDTLMCEWDTTLYLLFSQNVEPLVYYSHLFPALAILILAITISLRSFYKLTTKIFFTIATLYVLFSIFDLILWATPEPGLIMFYWSALTYIEPLIYAGVLYLFLVLIRQKDINIKSKLFIGMLFVPIILLGPTSLNLAGFDYTNCWRLAIEAPLATYYTYIIEVVFSIWILVTGIKALNQTKNPDFRKSIKYLMIGTLSFLVAFSSGNIFGTLLQSALGEDAWVIGQYGLFGMPIFLAMIMYLMVRYEIFSARMIYAEALLLSTFLAITSLLFLPNIDMARQVTLLTLLLFTILGYFLLSGIKNDISQRKQIEKLAERLEKANDRLKQLDKLKSEFVSIASHQLRSPLTSIRGYASMLLEGSYGPVTAKIKEPLERIDISSKLMALGIDDYLNVSRIETGNMKYNKADFNLRDEVEHVCDDLRSDAIKRGLALLYRTDINSQGVINADLGKTVQIVQNLIHNSIKYTEKGTVKILVRDDINKKKIYVDIIDTGIGINEETIQTLFQKFERADNANSVNIHGTGLGLYVAQKMAEAMDGTITVHSEGDGKGSVFTLEMPLAL